jgi:hypothetical protein
MLDRAKFADQAIDALGGTMAVADLFKLDQRVVSNWRIRGFPPDTYAAIAPMLAARGRAVPPQFFGQRVLENPLLPPQRARAENGKRAAPTRRA